MAALSKKQEKRLVDINRRLEEMASTYAQQIKKGEFIPNFTAKWIPEALELVAMIETLQGVAPIRGEPEAADEDDGE